MSSLPTTTKRTHNPAAADTTFPQQKKRKSEATAAALNGERALKALVEKQECERLSQEPDWIPQFLSEINSLPYSEQRKHVQEEAERLRNIAATLSSKNIVETDFIQFLERCYACCCFEQRHTVLASSDDGNPVAAMLSKIFPGHSTSDGNAKWNRAHFDAQATAILASAYNPTLFQEMMKKFTHGNLTWFSCASMEAAFTHMPKNMGVTEDAMHYHAVDGLFALMPCNNEFNKKSKKLVNVGALMSKVMHGVMVGGRLRKPDAESVSRLKSVVNTLFELMQSQATEAGASTYWGPWCALLWSSQGLDLEELAFKKVPHAVNYVTAGWGVLNVYRYGIDELQATLTQWYSHASGRNLPSMT